MPSIITHHIFSDEVYKRLNKRLQNRVKDAIDVFHAFSQSHDYLYYYTFHKDYKKIKGLGDMAHKNDTQKYLMNIILNIKEMNLKKDSYALAYLYGSVCHYVMDSMCHPFIFYKTGAWNHDDKNTYKYRGGHTMMEKSIDAIYYEKFYGKKYKYCNISKDIIKKPIFSDKLCDLINKTWENTYGESNMAIKYFKGIKDCKLISSLVINDRFGIKRFIYKLYDLITDHRNYIQYYSTHIINPDLSLLNLERKEWNNPANNELKYNSSFEDLFNEGILKVLKIIEVSEMFFNDKVDINYVKKYIPNLSYSNGLLLKDYKPMQYFEY